MRTLIRVLFVVGVLAISSPSPAGAAIIIDFAPPFAGNPDANLLFNDPSLTLSGSTIEGKTNTGVLFELTGAETLLGNGGQALVTAADGAYMSLGIEPAALNLWFTQFEANLNVLKPARGHASGTVTITAYDSAGIASVAQHAIGSQGSNFFNIIATDGDLVRAILIETTVGLADVRQIRVGGVVDESSEEGAVPEPAGLLLLGAGTVRTQPPPSSPVLGRRKGLSSPR